MKPPLSYVPALPVVIGLSAGILFAVNCTTLAWIVAVVTVVAAIVLWLTARSWCGALCFFVAAGIAVTMLRLPQPFPDAFDGCKCTLVGKIERATETQETMRYVVRVSKCDNVKCDFCTAVTVYSVGKQFAVGDVISIHGKLYDNKQYLDVPDQVDYSRYSFIDGVVARMGVHPGDISLIKSDPSFWQRLYNSGSKWLGNYIVLSGFDSKTSAFLLATIAGDDLYLSEQLSQDFRTIGLAHVLALSGLHVGIIVALVSALLFALRCLPAGRYIYYLSVAAAVLCYACITGMTPSVARAAVMVLVFIGTKLVQRSQSPYNSVCVAVSVWLIINPFWLWSPGLQLSVAAVLAIVWLGNLLNPFDHSQPNKRFVVALFVIPISAIVGTSMITLCYFHTFPVWFLPANIVASIFTPIIIGGGAIATALTSVGISSGYLPEAINLLYDWLERCVVWFAGLPGGQLTGIYPNSWQISLYILCLAVLVYAIYRRRIAYYCIFAMLAVLLVTSFAFKSDGRGSEMYVPRISASTDILIRHNDRALLVTNGDSLALSRATALYSDFLGKRGCSKLELAPDTFDIGPFARNGNYVYFGSKVMKIITSDRDVIAPTSSIDYALVGGGFKGNILTLACTVNADTIILANSINATRRRRYAAELSAASVAHISNQPFSFLHK
jgi:competence protein ComEC